MNKLKFINYCFSFFMAISLNAVASIKIYTEEEVKAGILPGMSEKALIEKFGEPELKLPLKNGDISYAYTWSEKVDYGFVGFSVFIRNGVVVNFDPVYIIKNNDQTVQSNAVGVKKGNIPFPNFGEDAFLFYPVSSNPIKDGQYIDTEQFPKLGYISNAPTFVLKKIKGVSLAENEKSAKWKMPTLTVQIREEDQKGFEEITATNLAKRILIVIGKTPILAPEVGSITKESFVITLPEDSEQNTAVRNQLNRLIKMNQRANQ